LGDALSGSTFLGTVAAQTTVTGEAQLFERHSDLVYRYCLRMLGSREDAEDATQTTFVQALRALRRGVTPNYEQAWLLTIARNECKSRYRAGSRRRARELAHDPQTLAEFAAAAPNGGDGRLIGVQSALTRLPETQRRALLLREWQGRSYAEIARELGVSRPAVEALLFRARRGLARELGEETRERRHALDLASLLAAAKSLLGGGAAVKVAAAGVAAVATVGVVAGGAPREPAPVVPVRGVAPETRPVADVKVRAPRRVSARREASVRVTPTRRVPVGRKGKPRSTAPAPVVAEAPPRAEQPSPSAPAPQPTAPPAQQPAAPTPAGTPSLPEVPSIPPAPPPPALPLVGELPLPPAPPLPQLPQVETPVPLPEVQVPEVPDLPIVGDVPILP
jgi:RNA polymerase sigma factor (sigma-70 family)